MSLMEKPQEVRSAKARVEEKLKDKRMARNYDQVLVLDLWEKEALDRFDKPLADLSDVERSELSSPGSITRARRDISDMFDEVKPDEHIQDKRDKAEKQMRSEYA